MRINRYISQSGLCSRREADRLIEEGAVFLNGNKAELGDVVNEGDEVTVNGRPLDVSRKHLYFALNKPKGIVCTLSEKEENNLYKCIDIREFITYAGRLDKDSEGLLILTNDGDLINSLMTGGRGHEKEYVVTVAGSLDDSVTGEMQKGVWLPEIRRKTLPCRAWISGENEFHIVLTQGINRQIRRMCKVFGLKVKKLERIRIENIRLGELKPGKIRKLGAGEIKELRKRAGCEQ